MYSTHLNFQMSFAGVDFRGEKESTKPRYQTVQLFNSVKHAFKHFWWTCSTLICLIDLQNASLSVTNIVKQRGLNNRRPTIISFLKENLLTRVRPFRLNFFFASKRIVSEQRSVSHEIRLFTSSIRFPFFCFFRLFSLQIFRNYSL